MQLRKRKVDMKYLVNGTEIKKWEKQAMENYKLPSLLLMERAALAVVEELTNGSYDLSKILIACGTGNNGGDGLAAARLLKNDGYDVSVCVVGSLDKLSSETRQQLEMYQAISGNFVTTLALKEYTVIVDAIFGIGCNREITGIAAEVIKKINKSQVRIVSVDIPSGICADTGKICGAASEAETTVTFFAEKLGMMLYPGREHCGKIVVSGLRMPAPECEDCQVITYTDEDLKKLPVRKENSHKGTFGKVLIIAGSDKICGAAYMAAAGAYRIGAGMVKIYTTKENQTALQTLLPEALLEIYDRSKPGVKQLKQCMEWADAIVIGPGLGTEWITEKILRYVIGKSEVPVVIDADGINILAKNRSCLLDYHAPLILTPHIQEMARLAEKTTAQILEEPIETAKSFAEKYYVTLVMKDARTIVADREQPLYINMSGNSGMATGGSGDVLAGMLGGLLAQGMGLFEASKLGVYIHGSAGDAAAAAKTAYSMTATDILDGIAEVTRV